MNRELKSCPYRVYGERRASLTVEGEFYYNETFMPCMGDACACYRETDEYAYCGRGGAHDVLTEEVME